MAPKYVFLRHGKKLFNNNKPFDGFCAHDPPLIENQEKDIVEKINTLKEKYGIPDKIFCSPFLRTRQTCDIINKCFGLKPVIYDNRLKEFLGWQKPKKQPASLEESTKIYTSEELLGVEVPNDVEKRINDFMQDLKDDNNFIYVITHGIVISKAVKLCGKEQYKFDELCGAFIDDDVVEFI